MSDNQRAIDIVAALGGVGNIVTAANCMTRLRVTVADEGAVDEAALKRLPVVLGLVHDREAYYEIVVGPGKAKTYAGAVRDMMKGAGAEAPALGIVQPSGSSSNDRAAHPSTPKPSLSARFKGFCKTLGGIFVPMIPGFIVSGICGSFAMIIQQLVPGYADNAIWGCLYNLLFLIQQSLLAYLTAWTGYRAAEQFGATPILGGMLGMITSMSNVNDIATFLGLYNADAPLSSVLMAGKGGVLAVVVGVFLLAKVEHAVDGRVPDVLKVIGTPLITMLICATFYVFAVMPVAGFAASWLCDAMSAICMSDNVLVRIVAGYVGAALFLPLVALYAIQLQAVGYVTLYPALCMAGAGQVGAALAIRHKAKKCGNEKVVAIADAGIPAGFLGVGEPLVYGLTLPMGKPFITAGLGAGFGGAFVMFMQVAATAWGPSGLLGLCVMNAGPNGIEASLGAYAVGLFVSYVMGFAITNAVVTRQEVAELYHDEAIGAQRDIVEGPPHDAEASMTATSEAVSGAAAGALQNDEGANTPVSDEAAPEVAPQAERSVGVPIAQGQPVAMDGMILFAPSVGRLIAQKDIDDKVFSEGLLGSCFGIVPDKGDVYAPCDGVVEPVTDTRHAIAIMSSQGQRVLIHVGLGTVYMEGAGFEPLVAAGDCVTTGQLILNFDPDLVRSSGHNDTIIVALPKDAH